jgi:thioredoxin-related protein
MKIVLVILMISLVAVLGCTQPDKQQNDPPAEAATGEATETPVEGTYQTGTWIEDFVQAKEHSKELNRPILMNFTGSDWCKWCFKLRDEVFTQDAFKDYAKDNLVLLTVDFPMKRQLPQEQQAANEALQQHYGIEGYPTILLVDSEGKEIGRTGYQPGGPENYVKHLRELLTK